MAGAEKRLQEHPVGVIPDRARPHADDLERAVLSALLRDPGHCVDTVIEICQVKGLFYSTAHQKIFEAILALHRDNPDGGDLVSVAQYLSEHHQLDGVGGQVYLAELYSAVATSVNLESWCRKLQEYALRRKMIDALAGSLTRCYDSDKETADLLDEIESDVYKVRGEETRQSIVELRDLLPGEFKWLMDVFARRIEAGIPTGFAPVDECTGGLKPGEMFVLAARPAIGKTALALNVVRNITVMCPDPRPVVFFSLEMTAEQLTRRMIAMHSGFPESAFINHTFNTADTPKITKAMAELKKAPLFIDPTPGLSLAELRAKARRLKQEKDIRLIVIDYLQLMSADAKLDSREREVAQISGGIKKLAKDLNIPVLVLAQLNREVDKATGQNARPKLANLRESGAIEQDADIVTFLHREREKGKNVAPDVSVEAEWIVEKNRNGNTANCKLVFYPARMMFLPAPPESSAYSQK